MWNKQLAYSVTAVTVRADFKQRVKSSTMQSRNRDPALSECILWKLGQHTQDFAYVPASCLWPLYGPSSSQMIPLAHIIA